MLNRTPPPKKTNTTNVIQSYRKRRMQRGPLLLYGAIALVVIGIIVIVVSFMGGGKQSPLDAMFPSETPTATLTFTPTNTNTPTATATITLTPTITLTATPSGPVDYILVEGDTLQGIAEKFNLGNDGVLLLLEYNPIIVENGGLYFVGQTISIPVPGTQLSTSTPLPENIGRGTRIEYTILPGDTLASIAAKFNSIVEDIITINSIDDANALQAGDTLQIPVNLVTATATLPPTSTPVTPTVEGQSASTATPASSTAACNPVTDETFVSQMVTLINNNRTNNGLPTLNINQQLTATANAHARDMLCNNYFSPIGLNGSTANDRVSAQGYTASVVAENLYALQPALGMRPETAFNWWKGNTASRENLLNPNVTEMGVVYVSDENTLFGAYFVVTFAKP